MRSFRLRAFHKSHVLVHLHGTWCVDMGGHFGLDQDNVGRESLRGHL